MRTYLLCGAVLLVGLLALPGGAGLPGPAVFDPDAAGPPTAVAAPETLCTTGDRRLTELSGLATDGGTGRWVIVDGSPGQVYRLGEDCTVRDTRSLGVPADDVEDLARTPDGTFWLADTGDNERSRGTVAVHALRPDGRTQSYRLRFPDGPHDTEALLIGRDGVPVLVTKELLAAPGVYRPDGPPSATEVTALRRTGTVSLPDSGTSGGPLGGFGTRMVTGGATTEDGSVAAVRTYTDAWLFAVPDGDLAAALTGTPVRVPLPNEPQGEAIAFDAGGGLLSGSERRDGVNGELRRVPGAAALVRRVGPEASVGPAPGPSRPTEAGRGGDAVAPGAGPGPGRWTLLAGSATIAGLAGAALLLWGRSRRAG